MANFDANRWYQVLVKPAGNSQSLDGSVLFTQGQGTVFFKDTNTTDSQEQWQIFPYNSSYYVLRTKASGAQGYLNTAIFVNETTLGGTVPDMRNTTQSDDSMFWQIHPWGDGTFYFTNAANRTAWHLEVNSNSQMAMSSNITAPQDGQSFTFNQLDAINDSSYSSVITPSATATGFTTKTQSPSSTQSSLAATSAPSSSNGLSSGASAAIGASIGAVALIIAFIIGFVLIRRRRRRSLDVPGELDVKIYELTEAGVRENKKMVEVYVAELHGQHQPAEISGTVPAELQGDYKRR